MLRIGLTGGIGSGKSTVAGLLREQGAVVVEADCVAREVVRPGTPGLAQVVERFGAGVLGVDGTLDRARLAAEVFEDAGARADLERITHPLIRARTTELVREAGENRIVVHDVPLLVEKDMGADYHLVVVVDAPARLRLRRLVDERGMSESDAHARMGHQASDDERRGAADVLLPNTGSVEQLRAAVDELWRGRLLPYDENLRAQRVVSVPGQPVLTEYDEEWPRHAHRLIERLSAALGERAPEIEHVGSTAVPGMPGKDVIDLQVGVARLSEADDPAFLRALAELGFPRIEDYRMDHPTDDLPDPSLWVKRFHGSCDPGRVVHVHVRELASAGWQYALLFRDWLRDNPDAADEYVAVKARFADGAASATEYAQAKKPWFNEIWPRIQAWAQRTGWQD